MASLVADNISLQFPLYQRAQAQSFAQQDGVNENGDDGDAGDDRVVIDPKGRILAIKALQNISFSLKNGDRLGLVGRNGSGKTTLLQVLAEIMVPDQGELIVEGRSTNLLNINLGMSPGASAQRNITLRGLAAGHSLKEIEKRRAEVIDFAELGDFIDMPVETYSSGMRMRLNFAMATAFEPEILILDEWLSTGDIAFREKATARMRQFVKKAGILVLASHSPKLLQDNCNRAIWLDRGRIRADGDVKDIWRAYSAEQEIIKKNLEAQGKEKAAAFIQDDPSNDTATQTLPGAKP